MNFKISEKKLLLCVLVFGLIGGIASIPVDVIPEAKSNNLQSCQSNAKDGKYNDFSICKMHSKTISENFRQDVNTNAQDKQDNAPCEPKCQQPGQIDLHITLTLQDGNQ